jgi:hypothetical protein
MSEKPGTTNGHEWTRIKLLFAFCCGTVLVFAACFSSLALAEQAMTSEQWAAGAVGAAFCEKPPCRPFKSLKDLEALMGPMKTDKEWRQLAESGDERAQATQCNMHGFKKDVDKAYYLKIVGWCKNEAEKGGISDALLLARLYASGEGGLSQSWTESYFWHAVRITNEHISIAERNAAAKHLTPQELTSADQRIQQWKENLCASSPTERNAIVMRDWHCKKTH